MKKQKNQVKLAFDNSHVKLSPDRIYSCRFYAPPPAAISNACLFSDRPEHFAAHAICIRSMCCRTMQWNPNIRTFDRTVSSPLPSLHNVSKAQSVRLPNETTKSLLSITKPTAGEHAGCECYSRIKYWCASTWMRQTAAGLSKRTIISFGDKLLSALHRQPTTAGPWLFNSLDGYSGSSSETGTFNKTFSGFQWHCIRHTRTHTRTSPTPSYRRLAVLFTKWRVTCEIVIKAKHK